MHQFLPKTLGSHKTYESFVFVLENLWNTLQMRPRSKNLPGQHMLCSLVSRRRQLMMRRPLSGWVQLRSSIFLPKITRRRPINWQVHLLAMGCLLQIRFALGHLQRQPAASDFINLGRFTDWWWHNKKSLALPVRGQRSSKVPNNLHQIAAQFSLYYN